MTEWIDVKKEKPMVDKPVWAASPNVVLCAYQTFLLHTDKDGQWRDEFGILFHRKVAFWQYAEVPVCEGVC
jgi:hypothetical protein